MISVRSTAVGANSATALYNQDYRRDPQPDRRAHQHGRYVGAVPLGRGTEHVESRSTLRQSPSVPARRHLPRAVGPRSTGAHAPAAMPSLPMPTGNHAPGCIGTACPGLAAQLQPQPLTPPCGNMYSTLFNLIIVFLVVVSATTLSFEGATRAPATANVARPTPRARPPRPTATSTAPTSPLASPTPRTRPTASPSRSKPDRSSSPRSSPMESSTATFPRGLHPRSVNTGCAVADLTRGHSTPSSGGTAAAADRDPRRPAAYLVVARPAGRCQRQRRAAWTEDSTLPSTSSAGAPARTRARPPLPAGSATARARSATRTTSTPTSTGTDFTAQTPTRGAAYAAAGPAADDDCRHPGHRCRHPAGAARPSAPRASSLPASARPPRTGRASTSRRAATPRHTPGASDAHLRLHRHPDGAPAVGESVSVTGTASESPSA